MSAARDTTPIGATLPGSFSIYNTPCTITAARDQAIIEVTFKWSDAGLEPWNNIRFLVSLNTDLYTLSSKIQAVCDEAILQNGPFLSILYRTGRNVRGGARIQFPDGDHYVNPTPTGRFRMEKVQDLFTTPHLDHGQCLVLVRVMLTVIDQPAHVRQQPAQPPAKTYRQARVETLDRLSQSKDSTYSPMTVALPRQHHGPSVLGGCLTEDSLAAIAREIKGVNIGYIDHPHSSSPWGANLLEDRAQQAFAFWRDPTLELPSMTFNDYVPVPAHVAGVAEYFTLHDQRIHLAIRMVNRIPSKHGESSCDEKLPANVLVSVKHGHDQEKPIRKALKKEALMKYGNDEAGDEEREDRNGGIEEDKAERERIKNEARLCAAIFEDNSRRMHIWIMPQTGSKKLYLFKGGGLANFLDFKQVSKGNTKMYMEAHLVPEDENRAQSTRDDVESAEKDEYAREEGDEISDTRALEKVQGIHALEVALQETLHAERDATEVAEALLKATGA